MKLKELTLTGYRSFPETTHFDFSESINIIIGPNNSGKSALLRSILFLQQFTPGDADKRKQSSKFSISYKLTHVSMGLSQYQSLRSVNQNQRQFIQNGDMLAFRFDEDTGFANRTIFNLNGSWPQLNPFSTYEPENLFYLFLSKRKVASFSETITSQSVRLVSADISTLNARVDHLQNFQHPQHTRFRELCRDILGFEISSSSTDTGKRAGYMVTENIDIAITEMGEGVSQIVGFITLLLTAQNKIFVIEELENDLHPSALKSLMKLILESSKMNQFFISTHSNIVVRALGSLKESLLLKTNLEIQNGVPTSSIAAVPPTSASRIDVLQGLGYDVSDYELWDCFLILEEATAERIIRDFLIPQFVPRLAGRCRTISSGGISRVKAKMEAFSSVFLFLHLEPIYRDKAWVAVDGDDEGKKIIENLKETYAGKWSEGHFRVFSEPCFEKYYPTRFKSKVTSVLALKNGEERQHSKKLLMLEVLDWALESREDAVAEFRESAAEVINLLQEIERAVLEPISI